MARLFALSDDPTVNGTADPLVSGRRRSDAGDNRVSGRFLVQKISTDLTGDPNILLAGETLRYTITANNTGNVDAVNVVLRDAVPANTTYVAGSTTLNGAAVADVGGLSPLVTGMLIHSPADPTPGLMPADPSSNPANVATITFDVVVNSSVADGTVISNQGFVTATANGIVDQPSDDPDTPIANDPTRDVVGNLPLLYAEKRVALSVDLGSPGVIDPGDTLRYTITVQNSAAIAATGVVLRDAFRRIRPTSRIPHCSTDRRSDSRMVAFRRSPRESTPARSRREPHRLFSSTCASTPVRPPAP